MRDCVYSVQCVWGLALAHRREQGQNSLRAWELEQRVVALMRGLMRSMMRQSQKVERFKQSLNPLDALHAKYDSCTGEPVVADDAWGHLQLDATSLFLLQLAQLTKGGCGSLRLQGSMSSGRIRSSSSISPSHTRLWVQISGRLVSVSYTHLTLPTKRIV